MKTIYLAGPITNCNKFEANDWRDRVAKSLELHGIRGISPLRCEPMTGARYSLGTPDPKFGVARAIAAKNMLDVRMCDMTLAYIPAPLEGRERSIGTLLELGWARMIDKPTILVTDDPYLQAHPVVDACAGWLLTDLSDAVEVAIGVLGDYARPGRGWSGRATR